MKKTIFTFIALAFTIQSWALIPGLSFEGKFGLGWNNVSFGNNLSVKAAPGYIFGANAKIGKKVFFEPGIYFTQSKSSYSGLNNGAAVDDVLAFTSTKISGLLGYRLIKLPAFSLMLHGGASYDLLNSVSSNDLNITSADFNKGTWGCTVGATAKIAFITFGVDYQIGLNESIINAGKSNILYATIGFSIL